MRLASGLTNPQVVPGSQVGFSWGLSYSGHYRQANCTSVNAIGPGYLAGIRNRQVAILLPRAHAQGVKQSVCMSVVVVVVVVVGTKIARSRVLGVCACYKHNILVGIGEKLVCTRFELLKKAY